MAKILVVEDEATLREGYKTKLILSGYSVVTAKDGKEGLAVALREQPDLILLDVFLPIMDGLQFLRQWKQQGNPETKVVVFSVLTDPKRIKEAVELGVTKYLTKQMTSPAEMIKTIKELLGS